MEDPNYSLIYTYNLTDLKGAFHVQNQLTARNFFYSIMKFVSEDEKIKKVKLLQRLSTTASGIHKNIVTLTILDLQNPLEVKILSEFAEEGSLLDEVQRRRDANCPFTFSEIKRLAYQLISACLHLQRLDIAHMNIRLPSVVKLRENLYKLTCFYRACNIHDVNNERLSDLTNEFISISGTGKKLFSPEILKLLAGEFVKFDPIKSDVYCLGLVLLGAACLDNLVSLKRIGLEARYSKINSMISESIYSNWFKSILKDMLEANPNQRLDFEELFIKYLDFKPRPKFIHEETDISYCIKLKFLVLNPGSDNQKRVVRATKQFEPNNFAAFYKELEFYRFFGSSQYTLNLYYSDETSKTFDLDFHEHSLQDYLNDNKYFTLLYEGISKKFVYRLIKAFEFFEEKGLVHGCIKPGHVLVTKKLLPIIIDFSTMVKYDTDQVCQISNEEDYRATELIGKKDSRGIDLFKAEVFSLGLVIFQLFAGYHIKKLNTLINRNILDQNLDSFPIPEIQSLLKRMLAPIPQARPTFKTLCKEYQSLLKT